MPATIATGVGNQNLAIACNSIGDSGAAEEGTYPITGVLSNGTGLAANYNVTLTNGTLTVNDAPLSATGTAVSATEGAAFSNVPVGTLTDAAGAYSHPSDLSATINWGDGTAAAAATLVEVGTTGVYTVKGSHTYANYGSCTISVSYHDAGGSTTTSTSTATVADAGLSATGKAVSATEAASLSNVPVGTLTDAAGSTPTPGACRPRSTGATARRPAWPRWLNKAARASTPSSARTPTPTTAATRSASAIATPAAAPRRPPARPRSPTRP